MTQSMEQTIIKAVSEHYNLTNADLTEKKQRRQRREVVNAKQVLIYLLWKYTKMSQREIVASLGYKKRPNTAYKAVKQIKQIAQVSKCLQEDLEKIESKIFRK